MDKIKEIKYIMVIGLIGMTAGLIGTIIQYQYIAELPFWLHASLYSLVFGLALTVLSLILIIDNKIDIKG